MGSHQPLLALIHEGLPVPEEDTGRIRFVSGALEGIMTHHGSAGAGKGRARRAKALVRAVMAAASGRRGAAEALYKASLDGNAVELVDDLLEGLARAGIGREALATVARRLVMQGAHRNPVKLGIAMLGLSGEPPDLVAIRTLGRHEDFTLYAAVAAANLLEDPTDEWWALAKQVHGWGKIHLVERLCERAAARADLRAWLLRHGCANSVMNEYLAACCARAGRLASALAPRDVDRELLDGACVIVRALLHGVGGPADGIDDYEDAPAVLDRLVRHLSRRAVTLEHLECARAIRRWAGTPGSPGGKSRVRWPKGLKERLAKRAGAILADPCWPDRVRAAFARGDGAEEWLAWTVAPDVGVDLWDAAFARLETSPVEDSLWWKLSERAEGDRLRDLVAFAETHLPLARIASGAAEADGFGESFQAHNCLESLLQNMAAKGVFSEALVTAALRNPVIRLRCRACERIAELENPGPAILEALRAAVEVEPVAGLRKDLKAALAKATRRR